MNIPDSIPCPVCRKRISPFDVQENIFRSSNKVDHTVILFVHSYKVHHDVEVALEEEHGNRASVKVSPDETISYREWKRRTGHVDACHGDTIPDSYCASQKDALPPLLSNLLGIQTELIASEAREVSLYHADAQAETAYSTHRVADATKEVALATSSPRAHRFHARLASGRF